MSRENVEIVRQVYDAVARRDTAAVLALYDPQVEWDYSRGGVEAMLGGRYQGHEGLRRWFRDWYEVFENVEHDFEELIDAGEHVIAIASTRGRGRASGAEVEMHHIGVWTIREGRITRVAWFPTREEAFEAVRRSRSRPVA